MLEKTLTLVSCRKNSAEKREGMSRFALFITMFFIANINFLSTNKISTKVSKKCI